VIAPRVHNREDWQRLEWADDMVAELDSDRYFRWFDSGDAYSLGLAEKILEVMIRTPWCKHWFPTRMHKFPKFRAVFESMQRLDNVMVRFSADSVDGSYIPGLHGSVIGPDAESYSQTADSKLCEAYANNGQCSGCRACWDKTIPVIAYPAHGRKMAKVIRLMSVQ
jgi:hypothetical protein